MTTDLWLSGAMAIAAGLVGCFAVMRRMTLAADALSHVALPGIGIALALHIHPIFGAAAMLAFGALTVWALENQTRLSTETIIGVVFSVALAAGSLMTSGDELVEALFGRTGIARLDGSAAGDGGRRRGVRVHRQPEAPAGGRADLAGHRAHRRRRSATIESLLPAGVRADGRAGVALSRRAVDGFAHHHPGRDREALCRAT